MLTSRLVGTIRSLRMLRVRAAELIAAGRQRHDDLFERSVAGPLADPVDGHFDLPRAGRDRRQRVGGRHAEVVVAVDGDDDLARYRARSRCRYSISAAYSAEWCSRRCPGRSASSRRPRSPAEHLRQELPVGAGRVLGRELDVAGERPWRSATIRSTRSSTSSRLMRSLCLRWMSEVAMNVWIRADSAPLTAIAARSMSLSLHRASPATVDALHPVGDRSHRFEVAWRCGRKSRLDDVDAKLDQCVGHLQLFVRRSSSPRAIARRRAASCRRP